MNKLSPELIQKAAGYLLSAANALQYETKQNIQYKQIKQPIQKTPIKTKVKSTKSTKNTKNTKNTNAK